ncbi:uncharacterized protein LOC143198232 isoform X2 [Rhynchophorus ferrugineus]|uniref:uncharacterized protein LOC143198232 isoform X2 n=1 Tax=Rhynchophorus ferrugineus TaxID=354439 RepID=UPI003FCEBF00
MGNGEAKNRQEDSLKDKSVEADIPTYISKPTSNLILAYSEGNYYPCIILDNARTMANGYLVFFLHSQVETEVFSGNVIGNLKLICL